jgi:hypothetical protein
MLCYILVGSQDEANKNVSQFSVFSSSVLHVRAILNWILRILLASVLTTPKGCHIYS